jgi:hypothetical protein
LRSRFWALISFKGHQGARNQFNKYICQEKNNGDNHGPHVKRIDFGPALIFGIVENLFHAFVAPG